MLCLCDKDLDNDVDQIKDFTQIIRRKELEEAFLLVNDDPTKKLPEYVQLLMNVKLEDLNYHVYYGEVKIIVNSFLNFYTTQIDEVIKDADTYSNGVTKDKLIMLLEKTINTHQEKQVEFGKLFLPVKTPWEKRTYEEIEKQYEGYMKNMFDLKEVIYYRLDKQSKIDDFAKEHFPIVVRKMSEIFDVAHLYIGMMLAENTKNTRMSLEEILLRLRSNLTQIEQERNDTIHNLVDQLYEKNKESMTVTRTERRDSKALAEAARGINQIKSKIQNYQLQVPIERLQKEVDYWSTKLDYFNNIANNLAELKAKQAQMAAEQKRELLLCVETHECPLDCKLPSRVVYDQMKEELRLKIINETRAMFTFYAVRGTDRIFYTDNIGPYYVDEFNHQNYFFDYGLGIYHLDCYGEFKVFPEYAYLFDKYGRYIMKDHEKLYQCAPCTSQYKLNEANYLDKVTADCGHSETINKRCRLDIKDPNDVAVLPDFDEMDIKQTLNTETVRYLWDSFGCVLPDALHDVGQARPKNPIHFLAHKLLYHKYKRTVSELQKKKKEAEQYRENIFKERLEKAQAASRKWKSKLVKKRKPEESDDSEFQAYLDARAAQDLFINALNMEHEFA